MNPAVRTFLQAGILNTVLPIAVVVGAVQLSKSWIEGKPEPERGAVERSALLVEVIDARSEDIVVHVDAQGSVQAAQQTTLQVEVAGRLTYVHPSLQVGGLVRAGEELVRVDPRDYRIAAIEAEAAVAQAQTALELERGRQIVAQREWELLEGELPGVGERALAVREPQIRAAELAIEAAQARLQRAQLAVSRTSVRAPFDAIVLQEAVEEGQYVTAQTPIATLAATSEFWIHARVPLERIGEISIPGYNGTEGSHALVVPSIGAPRDGRVLRLLGSVDASAQMATVVVALPDPLLLGEGAAASRAAGALPALLGVWVAVQLDAGQTRRAVRLPRAALRDGRFVWVMGADDKLEIREVTIGGGTPADVDVIDGVAAGDRVVTSHLSTPVAGMSLRVPGAPPRAEGSGE